MKVLASIVLLAAVGFVLACSDDDSDPAPTATPTSAAQATGGSSPVSLEITAEDVAFDQESLSVPANTQITINFQNNDAAVPHNFGIDLEGVDRTETCEGPCSASVTFDSGAPGTYTFNCSVHSTMTGEFIVQ